MFLHLSCSQQHPKYAICLHGLYIIPDQMSISIIFDYINTFLSLKKNPPEFRKAIYHLSIAVFVVLYNLMVSPHAFYVYCYTEGWDRWDISESINLARSHALSTGSSLEGSHGGWSIKTWSWESKGGLL